MLIFWQNYCKTNFNFEPLRKLDNPCYHNMYVASTHLGRIKGKQSASNVRPRNFLVYNQWLDYQSPDRIVPCFQKVFNQFIVGEILLRAFFWDAQYSEWTLFCNIICIRFYFKFCCLDYASFFESFSFFHLWSYIQIHEALFFVDFFGDRLGHTNMNRQLFCFLILAFFLLFIFFVIPIIVRTVRPGGGQNWDFFLIFFVLLLPLPLQVLSLSYQHKTTNHWTKKGTEVAAATHRASLKIK